MNKYLASIAIFSFLSSCATILNDDHQKVNVVASNGETIKGTIDGVPFTSGIVDIKRTKKDKVLLMDTPSCTKSSVIQSNVDPKFFINILSGGSFGSSTDFATEKMWKYQDTIVVQCK